MRFSLYIMSFGLLLFLGSISSQEYLKQDPLVIVVNKYNTISNISKYDLTSIFLGKMRLWPNGLTIEPIHFKKDSKEREAFSFTMFKKSSFRMQRYWIRAREHGLPIYPPTESSNANSILSYIKRKKNAISYVRLSDYQKRKIKKGKRFHVKFITIENISPKNKNYLLFVKNK